MSICLVYTNYIFYLLGVSCPSEGKKRRGKQRIRELDSITNSLDMNLSKPWETVRTGKPGVLQSTGSQESDTTKQLNTTTTKHS